MAVNVIESGKIIEILNNYN